MIEEDKDYRLFIETEGKHFELEGIPENIVKDTFFYKGWLLGKYSKEFKEEMLELFKKLCVKIRLLKG